MHDVDIQNQRLNLFVGAGITRPDRAVVLC